MFRNIVRTALLAACLCALDGVAHAQLIVSDGFDYAPGSITNDAGGVGWANNWTCSSADTPDQVTGGGLTFTAGGNALATSGGKLTTVGSDIGAYRRPSTVFGPYGGDTNQTVWISFLAANSAGANSQGYAGLSLYADDSSPEKFFIGQIYGSGQYGFVNYAPSNSNGTPFLSGVATDTTTHFLVTRLDFTQSGSTEASLYVDPTPGVVPTGAPQAMEDYTGSFVFNQFRFQSGSASTASYNFDELRMGNRYLDVAPVAAPEPSGGAVAAVGGLGLLLTLARRRRTASSARLTMPAPRATMRL